VTAAFASSALAAFGVTTSGSNIVVDAGSANPLKFTVNSNSCDITSILYRGEELQYAKQATHISSGLGTATVKSEIISSMYVINNSASILILSQTNMSKSLAQHPL
jgi:rhamnogalacturonan endolyase